MRRFLSPLWLLCLAGLAGLVSTAQAFEPPPAAPGTLLPIQHLAEDVLAQTVKAHRAKGASAVVLDAKTGTLLAMANVSAEGKPVTSGNPAAEAVSEPGFVLTPFLVAAALEKGHIPGGERKYNTSDDGLWQVNALRFSSPKNQVVTLDQALARSYEVIFTQMAMELKDMDLKDKEDPPYWSMLDKVGFGHAPGSGYTEEAIGKLPPAGDWSHIDTARLALGHGMTASLLQVARAYGAIANGGVLVPLNAGPAGAQGEQVMKWETARRMQIMLMETTSKTGTGYKARIPGVDVAGKTGTSTKPINGQYGKNGPYVARFVGMAPALQPRLVVAVMVDEPQGKVYQGGDVAAPAFARIMAGSLKRMEGLDTPPQVRTTEPAPFLKIKHSGCYGPCPEYEISLSSNGEVQYRGGAYAPHQGLKKARLEKQVVDRFAHALEEHKFFARKNCEVEVYDFPTS